VAQRLFLFLFVAQPVQLLFQRHNLQKEQKNEHLFLQKKTPHDHHPRHTLSRVSRMSPALLDSVSASTTGATGATGAATTGAATTATGAGAVGTNCPRWLRYGKLAAWLLRLLVLLKDALLLDGLAKPGV
jgi:transcription elongation factor